MTSMDRAPISPDMPSVEQLIEYRDLMVSIVRGQGKSVRYARMGERARTRVGTEYMLPGTLTDSSIPDRKFRTHTLRERRYSASFRPIGAQAGRLIVLESDSALVSPTTYGTKRNIYRFSWAQETGVSESEVLPIEIISSTKTDSEVLPFEPYGIKEVLSLDQEHTAEATADSGGEYQRYVNPFRQTESPWTLFNQVDFDGLLYRTDSFGRDFLTDLEDEKLRREDA